MRIFHIGEIILNELTIDGTPASDELFAAITADPYKATLNNVFTHIPVIRAKFVHGQDIEATASELDGTKVEYTFTASVEDKTRTYVLTVDGIHLYNRLDSDETVSLLYNEGAYNEETKEWSNGQFSLSEIDGAGTANLSSLLPQRRHIRSALVPMLWLSSLSSRVSAITIPKIPISYRQ